MATVNPIYSILYVHSDEEKLRSFVDAFSQDYHIYTAISGDKAFEQMEKRTIQLVIAAQHLADMDGIRCLEQMMSYFPDCSRMSEADPEHLDDIYLAAEKGIIFQYYTSPWTFEDLKISIEGAMELYHLKIQNRNQDKYLVEVKETLEKKVMERTRKIEQQRVNITDSIQYASLIQKALMLPSREMKKQMPPHFVLNKPKDIVSGDFYWVARKNNKLFLAVADCTGHGVPGAFMSIMGINFLNEIVSKLEHPQSGQILDELRSRTIRSLGQTGSIEEAREGMEIVLSIVDFENKSIQFSGAFRPLYLVSQGRLKVVKGDRMPIGIYHEKEVPFNSIELPFQENDIIYLCSDGYVDQIGGLDRKTFKSRRLQGLIQEIWDKPLKEQADILREEHEIWRAGKEQIDDLMIMGVQLKPAENKKAPA